MDNTEVFYMDKTMKRMVVIANNIKKLLKARGITQKKLANDLNLSQSAVTAWMKHRNAPTYGVIQDLADYFGVKITDIDSTWKIDEPIYQKQVLAPIDEKDIHKMLEGMLERLDVAAYNSKEGYEAVKASLESTLRISKILAKDDSNGNEIGTPVF